MLRPTLRRFAQEPGSTLTAVAVLALGIGLSAALLAVLRGTLWRSLPLPQGEEIVAVGRSDLNLQGGDGSILTAEDLELLREQASTLDGIAGFTASYSYLSAAEGSAAWVAAGVTTDFLSVLGAAPTIGRGFLPSDGLPGAERAAVISTRLWRTQLGADPDILGRQVKINRRPATIIGVAPEDFHFPFRHDLWLPLENVERQTQLFAFARLADDADPAGAEAELTTLLARLAPSEGLDTEASREVRVRPWTDSVTDPTTRDAFHAVLAAVLALLLIACVNVAHLLAARARRRRCEMAVRGALGADGARLAMEAMVEPLLLAAAGGALGLAVASAGTSFFRARIAESLLRGYWVDVRLDAVVIGAMLLLTLGAALLCGAAGARHAARIRPGRFDGHRVPGAGIDGRVTLLAVTRERFGKGGVAIQVALSYGLLVTAGLLGRSLLELARYDSGMDAESVTVAQVSILQRAELDAASMRRFADQLERRLVALPGAKAATLISALPHTPWTPRRAFAVAGAPTPGDEAPTARWIVASPGHFETFGAEMAAGRDFSPADDGEAPQVVVVNRAFVAKAMAGIEPLGARIRIGVRPRGEGEEDGAPEETWATVVGVAPDLTVGALESLASSSAPVDAAAVYAPLAQHPAYTYFAAVRGADAAAHAVLAPALRDAVREIEREAICHQLEPLAERLARTTWTHRLAGGLFAFFAVVALLLAGTGLHSVLMLEVATRRREIGVRQALGARPAEIVRRILGRVGGQIVVGLGLGTALAWALGRWIVALLPVVGWTSLVDPANAVGFAVCAAILLKTGLAAAWIPVRRACRVDAAEALRAE